MSGATSGATEEWRDVPGFSGAYQASTLGRIRSTDREVIDSWGRKVWHAGRMLTPQPNRRGRPRVTMYMVDAAGRKKLVPFVHQIVAETFLGPAEGRLVLHWDDDPGNNRVSNLRYGTLSDNTLDMVRNGRHPQSRKMHCPQGHPYSVENTYRSKRGRSCKACAAVKRERIRARKADISTSTEE